MKKSSKKLSKLVVKAFLKKAFKARYSNMISVTAAGGTLNCIAGELAKFYKLPFKTVVSVLEKELEKKFGEYFYEVLFDYWSFSSHKLWPDEDDIWMDAHEWTRMILK